jgi:hypothetical protein
MSDKKKIEEDEFFTQAEGELEQEYELPEFEGWEFAQEEGDYDYDSFYGKDEGEEEVEEEVEEDDEEDYFSIDDIDFSDFSGKNFKSSLSKVNKAIDRKGTKRGSLRKKSSLKRKKNLSDKSFSIKEKKLGKRKSESKLPKLVGERQSIPVKRSALIKGKPIKGKPEGKAIGKVIVPDDRKVIIEGVDKFMLSQVPQAELVKKISYYKGKKLNELILSIDNTNSAVDFDLELFNPSNPLDYLYSSGGNLNNRVQTASPDVAYSDILFNILANPTRIHNAQVVFSGVNSTPQINQAFIINQKRISGVTRIDPIQLALNIDPYQFFGKINYFKFSDTLDQPYVPNGMDVIRYKVLAGNLCNFCFFYEQIDLRQVFYKHKKFKAPQI